ncbi:hypothetical protein HanPSC8_Chr14g0621741 [Helianthus annuus]|nr:hypothetical protein HanPSC8_Chr14g0621741 [Helianthus annuus]
MSERPPPPLPSGGGVKTNRERERERESRRGDIRRRRRRRQTPRRRGRWRDHCSGGDSEMGSAPGCFHLRPGTVVVLARVGSGSGRLESILLQFVRVHDTG